MKVRNESTFYSAGVLSLFLLDAVQRQMEKAVGQPVPDLALTGLFWGQDTATMCISQTGMGETFPNKGKKSNQISLISR